MTPRMIEQMAERGYVVIPDVVPEILTEAAVAAICRRREFLSAQHDDVVAAALDRGLFPLWNAHELWAIRALPEMQLFFAALIGPGPLWSSLDRCGFRPEGVQSPHGLQPHWDDESSRWDFAPYQGVVALLPSVRGDGEFLCFPSVYRAYCASGKEAAERERDSSHLQPVHVELPRGAALLFDHRLLHGTGAHRGNHARAVQYVAYVPCSGDVERERRVQCWREGTWRGDVRDPTYAVPDEKRPSLTPDGVKALVGTDADEMTLL